MKFLSVGEIAERWNVNYRTVYRLVRSGAIPAMRIGDLYRVREDELEKFEKGASK